ncbi:nSTAND3 domain-containing NTPase [Amycolatopsis sp. NPDC004747]
MDAFDLGRLSPYDFETVCRDLFEQILGLPFEIFPQGRDRGIDLRHVADDGSTTIVQCKHWPRGTAARLVRAMLRDERPKISALNPARYLLATSVELTAAAKDKLAAGLAPQVNGPGDLYGAEQLVEELRKRPEIVERHFRLWLSSTGVLQSLLRKESLIRSADLLADLEGCALTFVPTPAFYEAKRLLSEQAVCIVTGGPGVGKTTIAKMLATTYRSQGYELVAVSPDADEINAAWRDDVPQFFYYDDFLGRSTFGDKLGKNEDSRLLQIIERVRRTPGKRLVLTTRDYLFKQAERMYGSLGDAELSPVLYFVNPAGFDADLAAKLLYSLVHHSGIPAAEKRRFGDRHTWTRLVYSENFNPRLAERTLGLSGFSGTPATQVAEQMLANFDEPERIWERVVEDELDNACLHVLELLTVLDVESGVSVSELAEVWQRYTRAIGAPHALPVLHRALKVLDGALLTSWGHGAGDPWVGVHNASVLEYLEGRLHRGRCDLDALIDSLADPEHLARLYVIGSNVLDGRIIRKLCERAQVMADVVLECLVAPCHHLSRFPAPTYNFGRTSWLAHVTDVLAHAESLRSVPLVEHAVGDLEELDDLRPGKAGTFAELADLLATALAYDLLPRPLVARLQAFVVGCARDLVRGFAREGFAGWSRYDLSWAVKVIKEHAPGDDPRPLDAAERAVAAERRRDDEAFARKIEARRTSRTGDAGGVEESRSAVIERLRILLASTPDD